ncbi:hypothetical protein GGX14DRAFT_662677 [Mycena pura]|uniref:Uncharacterized protein n=1 Tax=Mycena pura TaxID=153505 RepID=A0AAD6VTY1_9AGAR|nr:hypothetical protein GGX14DRAFT_662677 [Mycena pura]
MDPLKICFLVMTAVSLTSTLILMLACISPAPVIHTGLALMTVGPPFNAPNGPSVFLGLLGSCSRPTNGAHVSCTKVTIASTVKLVYDLEDTKLPAQATDLLLDGPNTPTSIVLTLVLLPLSACFCLALIYLAFMKERKRGDLLSVTYFGVVNFIIGVVASLVLYIRVAEAVQIFNNGIHSAGLRASVGNSFIMFLVAFETQGVLVFVLRILAPKKEDGPPAAPTDGPAPSRRKFCRSVPTETLAPRTASQAAQPVPVDVADVCPRAGGEEVVAHEAQGLQITGAQHGQDKREGVAAVDEHEQVREERGVRGEVAQGAEPGERERVVVRHVVRRVGEVAQGRRTARGVCRQIEARRA